MPCELVICLGRQIKYGREIEVTEEGSRRIRKTRTGRSGREDAV